MKTRKGEDRIKTLSFGKVPTCDQTNHHSEQSSRRVVQFH